ncbi:receptor-like protein kinase HERK 1 [Rutidosis leptorrhynchoides]|uniref:receptor-like protein kinase HERK 1 n=1 Tax=Rutidosis leptorrhynchoides TaxID=125765 RepID=UPI003A9A409B
MASLKESEHLSLPFPVIEAATKKFTTFIGSGGYGQVYKGELSLSGELRTVAVKRLSTKESKGGQGVKEFLTEIQLLSRYKHPNIVSLLGFCDQGDEKILIYEYAEHGSLDTYLRGPCTFSWKQRINICIDAACGLDHLHNHVSKYHRVIHRDIKSGNILLGHNWKAMIADLGLSRIGLANENVGLYECAGQSAFSSSTGPKILQRT